MGQGPLGPYEGAAQPTCLRPLQPGRGHTHPDCAPTSHSICPRSARVAAAPPGYRRADPGGGRIPRKAPLPILRCSERYRLSNSVRRLSELHLRLPLKAAEWQHPRASTLGEIHANVPSLFLICRLCWVQAVDEGRNSKRGIASKSERAATQRRNNRLSPGRRATTGRGSKGRLESGKQRRAGHARLRRSPLRRIAIDQRTKRSICETQAMSSRRWKVQSLNSLRMTAL
jgi:hypothetical protein